MATIRVDRGFTQKIQQKGLSHPVGQAAPPPHKPHPKGSGPSGRTVALVAGGAFLLVGVVVAVAVVAARSGKAKPAQAGAAAPAGAARQAPAAVGAEVKAEARAPLAPPERTGEPDPYADYQPRVMPAGSATQAMAAASSSAPKATAPISREVALGSPNGLLCEYFERVNGPTVDELRASPRYPKQPDRVVQAGRFELSERLGVNYGVRVRGYVTSPASGAYSFVLNVDDGGELWLSTDERPENVRRLVRLVQHTHHKWNHTLEQQSAPVQLEGGRRYYIEALMKQSSGGDYLAVGWFGPVSEKVAVIEGAYLQPWTEAPSAAQALAAALDAAGARRRAREEEAQDREAARAEVAAQMKAYGGAYRYAEAARVLKAKGESRGTPAYREAVAAEAERFEALAQLRAFVQAEVARTRPRGVWTAFGGQADVTAADDEGVTVAPGRIVAWDKVPPEQMLRLVHATVPKAAGEAGTRGALLLSAALFCKQVGGDVGLALKYRTRALEVSPGLAERADQLLGGSPEAILAEPLARAAAAELVRLGAAAEGLAERALQRLRAAPAGPRPGLLAEYWDNVSVSSLEELRSKGITRSRPPDESLWLPNFEIPTNRADRYVARITGYLTPKVTGEYYFYVASDDSGEIWLGADENADKVKLIVSCPTAVGRYAWDRERRRSDAIRLEAGRRYAVKGLLREGGQSDHFEAAWSWAEEDKPKLITGEYLTAPAAGAAAGATAAASGLSADEAERVSAKGVELLGLCEPEREERAGGMTAAQRAEALGQRAARAKALLAEVAGLLGRAE